MEKPKATDGMLAKGLRILIALADHPDGEGVSQLAREVGVPVSTAHRLLGGMMPLGFVSFEPERRRYHLGLRMFELSQRVASLRRLSDVARPTMQRAMEASGETTLLAVRAGEELVYVERVEGQHRAQIIGYPGERHGWLHCTSLGKSLLAFLPAEEQEQLIDRLRLERLTPRTITDPNRLREELALSRERGYAVNDEELEEGICAVGVPIMDSRGRPVASMSIATLTFRYSVKELEQFVPLLLKDTREISMQLP
jgi:DNA-binding IclR family transcriptional regulator